MTCTRCKHHRALRGKRSCQRCMDQRAAYMAKRRAATPPSPDGPHSVLTPVLPDVPLARVGDGHAESSGRAREGSSCHRVLTAPAVQALRWLNWKGLFDRCSPATRERHAAAIHAAGLSLGDLNDALLLARRKAKRSRLGLMAFWIREGLVRSVLDEQASKAKAANRTRPAFVPIEALVAITSRLCGAVRLVDAKPPPFDRRALEREMARREDAAGTAWRMGRNGPGIGRERTVAS